MHYSDMVDYIYYTIYITVYVSWLS